MSRLRDQLDAANARLESREQDILELQRKLQVAEARIEDLTGFLGWQASALVVKDQEIIFLKNQLRDLLKGEELRDA